MKTEIKKLPQSEVEITVTVPAETFMQYWDKGLKRVQEVVEIDGFRKGHAPENMIVQKFGDMAVLEEMSNILLRESYLAAITEHKIMPVSDPKVTIKKLAKDNPFEFSMIVAVVPEVELPDYKKLAKGELKEEAVDATDEEVENVLKELQKGRTGTANHNHEGHDHSHEGHDHAHDVVEGDVTKEAISLPPLDDAFAQSFGDTFKTLEDLKAKVRENLSLEKKQKLSEKNRSAIMEKLIAETKAELPQIMIDQELNRMLAQMKADITRFGGTWAEYLAHSKKTEDEIKTDWKGDANKRVMSQLVLAKIAEAEKLLATEEEIEVEMIRLLAQIQDADPQRAKEYLFQALTNEKVLKFLEQ